MSRMHSPRHMQGVSLIELMVALVIGLVLIFGATQVYVDSRNTYTANETLARMQETARLAMSVIEPDVRMAGYLGLVKGAEYLSNESTFNSSVNSVASAVTCGTSMIGDFEHPAGGANNSYSFSSNGSCNSLSSWATSAVLSADTLIVRRVANATTSTLTVGKVQVCSTRTAAYLFYDGAVPSGCTSTSPEGQINDMIVDAYYIDKNSSLGLGTPSLRRKSLTVSSAKPAFQDEEIAPGVEDMQVEYGVELGVDATTQEYTGVANRYVDGATAKTLVDAGGQVVAVRVWLLVRADSGDVGVTDSGVYQYADRASSNGNVYDLSVAGSATKAFKPSLDATAGLKNLQRYRRLLVSRTIQIRNAEGT